VAKTKRKWVVLDWTKDGVLRAQDIPYDETTSIKTKIDSVSGSPDDDFTTLSSADSISLTDEVLIYDKSIGGYRKTTVVEIRGSGEVTTATSYTEQATSFTDSTGLYYVDISHNLDSTGVVSISSYDSTSWLQIIPLTVDITDNNTVRLWFSENPGSIDVLVLPYTSNSDEQYKETITSFSLVDGKYQANVAHSLDASPPIQISCYDSTNMELIVPYEVELLTDSTASLLFSEEPVSIDVFVTSYNTSPYGYSETIASFTSSGDQYYVDVSHSLDSRPLDVSCYSTSTNKQIFPSEVELTDTNTARLWFDIDPTSIEVIISKTAYNTTNITANATTTFAITNSDLVSNKYTATHNFSQQYVTCQVYNNNDRLIMPDEITLTNTNSLEVDLTGAAPISGTWHIVVSP